MAASDRIRSNYKTAVDLEASREKRASVSVELRSTNREEVLGKKRAGKGSQTGSHYFGVNQYGVLVTDPSEMGMDNDKIIQRTQNAISMVILAIPGGAETQTAHDELLRALVELFNCTDAGGDVAGRWIVTKDGMNKIKECFYMRTIDGDTRICRCCLWIMQNISAGGRAEVEYLIAQEFPSIVFALLDHPSFDVRSDACTCIRNIVIESISFRDTFVSMGILAKLEQQLDNDRAPTDYLVVVTELLCKLVARKCLATQPLFDYAFSLLYRLVESSELRIAMYAIDGLYEISLYQIPVCLDAISAKRDELYPRLLKLLPCVSGERLEMPSCRRLVLKLLSNMVARQETDIDADALRNFGYTARLRSVLETCSDIVAVKETIYTLQNLTVGPVGKYIGDLLDNGIFRTINTMKYRSASTMQESIAVFFAMALQYSNDIQKVHVISFMALPIVIEGVTWKVSQSECLSAIMAMHVWGAGWTSESEKHNNPLEQEIFARLRQLLGYSSNTTIQSNPVMTMIERLASNPKHNLKEHLLWLEQNEKNRAIATWAEEIHEAMFEVPENIDIAGSVRDSMHTAALNDWSFVPYPTTMGYSGRDDDNSDMKE